MSLKLYFCDIFKCSKISFSLLRVAQLASINQDILGGGKKERTFLFKKFEQE